ncbi:MAG: inactive transglutaminase family protein [Methylomicrobium sp.]|nr:inactive transglutaminase family protein [Methylomicrobium sp.]
MKNLHVNLLATLLILVSASICYYKVTELKLPLLPVQESELWTIEAKVTYKRTAGPSKVSMMLPKQVPGFVVLDENFVSGRYGLTLENDDLNRVAQWAIRRSQDDQTLYYRMQLIPGETPEFKDKNVVYPGEQEYPEIMRTALTALLEQVRNKSADTKSFTHQLLQRLNAPDSDENVKLLRKDAATPEAWVSRVISILQDARIPARQVNLLILADGARHSRLVPWLQVYTGERWVTFNPKTGESGFPSNAVLWKYGDKPLLDVSGGKSANVDFSIYKQSRGMTAVTQQRAGIINGPVMEFSLFNLPVQTQNVYRILIMMPVGVLLIVLLRNIVGLKTFGTFMPILIAMAFRETELAWGLALFCLLLALGLMIRFYLEYLRLLLVPRLAAVLIIVIILMTFVSLLSHKLGIDRGLSVALFPMVIIAMTIERMSLVWEEHGAGESLQQCAGSLFVASISYLLMTNEYLEHLMFVFPELLLTLLAFTLWLGRYTGYRISELWRFRSVIVKGN